MSLSFCRLNPSKTEKSIYSSHKKQKYTRVLNRPELSSDLSSDPLWRVYAYSRGASLGSWKPVLSILLNVRSPLQVDLTFTNRLKLLGGKLVE